MTIIWPPSGMIIGTSNNRGLGTARKKIAERITRAPGNVPLYEKPRVSDCRDNNQIGENGGVLTSSDRDQRSRHRERPVHRQPP
jgi:hypothetical protein